VPYAVALKKVVDAPVGAVGRLNTPQIGEQLLQEGKADFILLGRSLLVDSLWVVKAKEGVEDDIVHCITCNHCIDVLMEDKDVKCSMNQDL
jgi:2,4-dienoyl-CoA reductase-like NADH-dependent reductase (Old Yellow Enzyme family)